MGKIYEALRRAEQERTRRWDLPVAPEESAFKEIAKDIGKDAVERQKVFDGPVNKLIVTAKWSEGATWPARSTALQWGDRRLRDTCVSKRGR